MTLTTRDARPSGGDSRALVRRLLLQRAPLSRAELAEQTGLGRPAISEICRELVEHGLVRETGARTLGHSAVGRRRVQLDLCADAGYALGVLVAAENSAITVLDLKGQVIDTVRVQPPPGPAERVLGFLAAAAQKRTATVGIAPEKLVGVGVSVPGVVDSRAGWLRLAPFFGWADVPVRAVFATVFRQPVSVANPLEAIAAAEMLFGSAARLPRADLALVNVSTATGAAFVLGGRLQRGADFASGQIGHLITEPDGRVCACGRQGCLDAQASGDALVAIAAEQGHTYASFSDMLVRAQCGDEYAMGLLDASAVKVGTVVGDLITTLNPTLVVISGMVLRLGPRYVDHVRAVAMARAWRVADKSVQVVPSAFGVHAAGVGAAAIALETALYSIDR